MLVRPPQPTDATRWREYGWRAEPDIAAAAAEHEALRELLEGAGAEVIVTEDERGNPDAIYTYDPVLVASEGAVLLRPGKDGRLRRAARARVDLRPPAFRLWARSWRPGTIEGGDTLWLDRETLLVGRRLPDERAAVVGSSRGLSRTPRCSRTTCRTGTAAPR